MEILSAFIPIDRQEALAKQAELPEHTQGAALFADVSGFTPLTDALARELGPQRAAEELTRHLNDVFDALIFELHRFGGTVISFSGDAITCWFDLDTGLRAVTCALAMQKTMQQFASVVVPSSKRDKSGLTFELAVKATVAIGPALRCVVGDPNIQLIDVLAGETLERLVAAEHLAKRGEVVLEPQASQALKAVLQVAEWRQDPDTGALFCVVKAVETPAEEHPFPPIPPGSLLDDLVRPWLLYPVYERLRQGQGEFLADLRPALVLFLNFSGIDYDHDQDAKSKLDNYIRWVQSVVDRYAGHLLQLMVGDKGSSVYASFGAPIAHEDDAIRAASAALELHSLPPEFNYIQNVKIGLNQGRLFAGAYGGKSRRTYGVMGDNVILAARLMTAASPGQILAPRPVRQITGSRFIWENLPDVLLKGKTEPVAISSLLGIQASRMLRLSAPEYALPMVGREQEIAICKEKLAEALQGHGQIVAITAEAGLGKSRLISEIILHATLDRNLACYGGECQSYSADTSYLVWQPIWRGLFNLDSTKNVPDQIEDLKKSLEAIDPALMPRLPLLGTALNIAIPDNDITGALDAKLRKASLEALLVDCLRFWARQQPLVLVLEDCQWMDSLSHEFLEVLGRAIQDLPIYIILAFRPPEALHLQKPRISLLPNYTEIHLTEFTPLQSEKLIALKLGLPTADPDRLPRELVNRIVNQADGNPFYIEELLNLLHDQGIDPQDKQAIARLDLPTSLHSLILSRLDQLSENQQITLKVASVIGRLFQAALLWGTYPELGSLDRVQSDLEDLKLLDLTGEDASEQELTYFFKQIVTQQVAYENLPFATRATLHGQLALYIERNFQQAIDQFVDLLAFHFLRGENWSKALEYNLRAARRARHDFANESALASCQHALEAADRIGAPSANWQERLEIHEISGELLMLVGRYDDALQQNSLAQEVLESQTDLAEIARHQADLCRKRAVIYERRSEYELAFEWLEKGLASLDPDEPTLEAAQIHLLGSGLYHRQAKNDDAVLWIHRTQAVAMQLDSREAQQTIAQTKYLMGSILWKKGDYAQSIDFCNQAIQVYEDIDDIVGLMKAYNNLAIPLSELGKWNQAREAYHKSLSIAQKIGDIDQQGKIANNLALILMDQGDWDQAVSLLEQSNTIYRQVGALLPEAIIAGNIAQVLIYRGDLEQARQLLERCREIYSTVGTDDFLSELERRWGEFFLKMGALDQALLHAQRSLELAVQQEARLDEGLALRLLGEIYLAEEQYALSDESLQRSYRVLAEVNSEVEAIRTLLIQARLALKHGSPDLVRQNIVKAIPVLISLGARPDLERAMALQSKLSQVNR